jgi:hypothetical protein
VNAMSPGRFTCKTGTWRTIIGDVHHRTIAKKKLETS